MADANLQMVSIGGNLARLANQFVIADAELSSDRKSVATTGYVLQDR